MNFRISKHKTIYLIIGACLVILISVVLVFRSDEPLEKVIVSVELMDNTFFDLEVADTEFSRRKGLMFRESLGDREGMIFIFHSIVQHGFWMKDTLIPLDMIFLNNDGEIVEIIKDAVPCKAEPCKSYTPEQSYSYVVEINGGVSDEIGLTVGSKIDLREITQPQ